MKSQHSEAIDRIKKEIEQFAKSEEADGLIKKIEILLQEIILTPMMCPSAIEDKFIQAQGIRDSLQDIVFRLEVLFKAEKNQEIPYLILLYDKLVRFHTLFSNIKGKHFPVADEACDVDIRGVQESLLDYFKSKTKKGSFSFFSPPLLPAVPSKESPLLKELDVEYIKSPR